MNEENKKRPSRAKLVWALLFLVLFSIVFLSLVYFGSLLTGNRFDAPAAFMRGKTIETSSDKNRMPQIILDAGHGGHDSGAVGVSGTSEKEINLALTERVAEHLKLFGFDVLLTRDGDYMLEGGNARSKKLSDVTGRVKFAAEHPEAEFISIHMNTNPVVSCRGVQLYYSKNNDESKPLALTMQAIAKDLLQPENKREPKAAGSNIFILDRIESPAILIECGFISNPDEEALLNDECYREKMAFIIAYSIYKYNSVKG